MSRVFADACYWIALLHRKDELHGLAAAAEDRLKHATLYTTDEVLAEVLNGFCKCGPQWRLRAAEMVEAIRTAPHVVVDAQSRETFDAGLALYKDRWDKGYSIVDCVSFLSMKHHGIREALTNDHHFEQETFVAMLRHRAD